MVANDIKVWLMPKTKPCSSRFAFLEMLAEIDGRKTEFPKTLSVRPATKMVVAVWPEITEKAKAQVIKPMIMTFTSPHFFTMGSTIPN